MCCVGNGWTMHNTVLSCGDPPVWWWVQKTRAPKTLVKCPALLCMYYIFLEKYASGSCVDPLSLFFVFFFRTRWKATDHHECSNVLSPWRESLAGSRHLWFLPLLFSHFLLFVHSSFILNVCFHFVSLSTLLIFINTSFGFCCYYSLLLFHIHLSSTEDVQRRTFLFLLCRIYFISCWLFWTLLFYPHPPFFPQSWLTSHRDATSTYLSRPLHR